MKNLFIILTALLLTACGTTPVKPENQLVDRVSYIIKIPPADLMTLPAATPAIDVDSPTLKQSDIARWVKMSEDRQVELENKLIGIASFFKSEQDKLNDQAKKENTGK